MTLRVKMLVPAYDRKSETFIKDQSRSVHLTYFSGAFALHFPSPAVSSCHAHMACDLSFLRDLFRRGATLSATYPFVLLPTFLHVLHFQLSLLLGTEL